MSIKWNLIAWISYTIGCYLVLLPFKQYILSISISIIIGFVCMLLNTIIQILIKILQKK